MAFRIRYLELDESSFSGNTHVSVRWVWKIHFLKCAPYLPGDNELKVPLGLVFFFFTVFLARIHRWLDGGVLHNWQASPWANNDQVPLLWCHNEHIGISNYRLNCLFRADQTKHKGPVTWKMFRFDDVIMSCDTIQLARSIQSRISGSSFEPCLMYRLLLRN